MNKSVTTALVAGLIAAAPITLQAADAQEHWTTNCAKCHGPDGAGKTPVGRMLKLKDYTDPAVQAAMTDEDMARTIKEGTKSAAGKQIMPAFADKIPEEDLPALIAFVRSLKKE